MVFKWDLEFRRGRTSIEGGPLSVRPKSPATPDVIDEYPFPDDDDDDYDKEFIGVLHEIVYGYLI